MQIHYHHGIYADYMIIRTFRSGFLQKNYGFHLYLNFNVNISNNVS